MQTPFNTKTHRNTDTQGGSYRRKQNKDKIYPKYFRSSLII